MAEDDSKVVSTVSQMKKVSSEKQASVRPLDNKVKADQRKKMAAATMSLRTANVGAAGGSTFGNVLQGGATNIYSPHLSTDFLELPQNLTEQRSYYRHFYNNDPYVGQAIDLHTDLPLSKIRLTLPDGQNPKRNRTILKFFEDMVKRVNLLEVLSNATREYLVVGEAFIWAEDGPVNVPKEVTHDVHNRITEDGRAVTEYYKKPDAKDRKQKYIQNHYRGWEKITILPPDQVNIESRQFSDSDFIELIPDKETKGLIDRANQGDPKAAQEVLNIPEQVRQYLEGGHNIPLATDPNEGSFVYHFARNKQPFETHGTSLLQRCLRDLVYRDKLRQAQTSIASRAMTPKRLVYAEDLNQAQLDDLRFHVDEALRDPDYSVVTNYEVRWEEISANDRLLNLSSEYDMLDRRLFAGLGVTESMLTGDSSYSGERINIEVINTRYMQFRERIQHYVEEKLFKPVARKKGFVEYDEYGNEKVLYPKLSFTRLAVRDNRDTFDSLFNLYQKGSLSVRYILELLNLDPQAVREEIEQDLFTVNDPTFNEAVRSILSDVGRGIVEESDFKQKMIQYISKVSQFDITYSPPDEGGGRF